MRTTVTIDDDLYGMAKERAARTGRSVGALIEDALRRALFPPEEAAATARRLPTFGAHGVQPGIDLSSNAALRDLMEAGERGDA